MTEVTRSELTADERQALVGASLRGDRQALTQAFVALCIRRQVGSQHRWRVAWLLRLLAEYPFGWTTLPGGSVEDLSEEELDAMIFNAAQIAYGDLAVSPSRAS